MVNQDSDMIKLTKTYKLKFSYTDKYGKNYYIISKEDYNKIENNLMNLEYFSDVSDIGLGCLHTYNERFYLKSKSKLKKNVDKAVCKFHPYDFEGKQGMWIELEN